MKKRQLNSIFHHNTNKIDLIIRADAIFLPVIFQWNVFPSLFSLVYQQPVCLRNSCSKNPFVVCGWAVSLEKSKPCFSLLYLACQCVGCQLCILFFRLGAWKSESEFFFSSILWSVRHWTWKVIKLCRYSTSKWYVNIIRLSARVTN